MNNKKDAIILNFQVNIIEKFIEKRRPPAEIRDKVDLNYTYKDGVVEIFEILPMDGDEEKKIRSYVAKSKFIKSKNVWKIYWKRANGNWDPYKPQEEVKNLTEFLRLVDEDEHDCFWG